MDYANAAGEVYIVFDYIDAAGNPQWKSFFMPVEPDWTVAVAELAAEEEAFEVATEYDYRPSLGNIEVVPLLPTV